MRKHADGDGEEGKGWGAKLSDFGGGNRGSQILYKILRYGPRLGHIFEIDFSILTQRNAHVEKQQHVRPTSAFVYSGGVGVGASSAGHFIILPDGRMQYA